MGQIFILKIILILFCSVNSKHDTPSQTLIEFPPPMVAGQSATEVSQPSQPSYVSTLKPTPTIFKPIQLNPI